MSTDQISEEKAEAFAERVFTAMDGASLMLLMSVGHQTGLFDKLAELPASTSEDIAAAAGLQERYVREWLGGMAVSEVVEYDAAEKTYRLPAEHAATLTRAAGPDNLAFFSQYVALLAGVEAKVVKVFKEGGGVPYSAFERFQEVQREETARVYDVALVEAILPLADGLIDSLQEGIDVLDVGTGAGHAINVMAKAFPNSRFTGADMSEEGVALGTSEAKAWGLANASFKVEDAAETSGQWDLITAFDTIHDQARPTKTLAAIHHSLRPGGVFLMGDISFSSNLEENIGNLFAPSIFAFSVFHCMTVSLAQDGEALGTAWGTQRAVEKLEEGGFREVDVKQVEGDFLNNYYITRKA
jgi:2-polyprenyl-3-methyl-5-hydroxy-6-metoxy-1,4-benzoquinol methylase